MILLVLSDSHGHLDPMIRAVERTRPDAVCHLGDGWREARTLASLFPQLPFYQVPGNCDLIWDAPAELTVTLAGHRVCLCHGDRWGVKSSLSGLAALQQQTGAELVLFGHTHTPFIDHRYGAMLLNPGSVGLPRRPGANAYAVAVLEEGRPVNASLHDLTE